MKTSKHSTRQLTLDELISSAEASHVSHLAQQESGPGHPTIDIYGRKCSALFEKLAPRGSWRRTFAASLVGTKGWFSTRCALTWKVKATKSFRPYFLLQASTRRTAETASGLLLTPTTREEPVDLDKFKARMEKYPNGTTMPNLATQVQQMLPTPRAWDGAGGGARPVDQATGKLLRGKDSATLKDLGKSQMLPTPMAQESDKITGKENQDSMTKRVREATGKTSQLSPLFVEEMMGFPQGWTVSPFQSGDGKA